VGASGRRSAVIFGPDHYVPVLKVKRGEKKALQAIPAALKPHITPLLEIVERKHEQTPTIQRHLDTAFRDLPAAVETYRRCMLDAREIAPDGPSAAEEVFRRAAAAGMAFTPVTGFSGRVDVSAALGHRENGLAIRLTREEFEVGGLARKLELFVAENSLSPEDVDLIVDLGPVDDLVLPGVAAFAGAFLAEVPDPTHWRTLILSACAFPPSMGVVNRQSHFRVERNEWKAWRDELFGKRTHLKRLPSYSDSGIQHPTGVEGFDPRTMQVSASIRYTLDEDWLLIKGESTRATPASEQFPELATRLVYGHHRHDFAGPAHCPGCLSMKAAADGSPRLGSAEAWRRLGTIHHVTKVAEALVALPWP
jgi:hypothetical protein